MITSSPFALSSSRFTPLVDELTTGRFATVTNAGGHGPAALFNLRYQ